jgi:hypothetical protein
MSINLENHLNFFELDRGKNELTENEINYLDTLSEDEINRLCQDLNDKYNYHNAVQTGLKLILNSIYGAFGNEFFVCSTSDIAGGITAMCRDIIKYMDNINETYFYEYWHEDKELHEHLGITNVKPLDNTWIHRESKTDHEGEVTINDVDNGIYQRKYPVSFYVDTDSLFVGFQYVLDSCDYDGDIQSFIEKISKFRLEPLFKSKLNFYAKKYNVENIQDFELENINESILFVAKKKYIKHTIWEDGRQYERLTNIAPKGVDLIKKGTSVFARKKVMEIINYLFDNPQSYNIKDLLSFVKDVKKEFVITDIDDITTSARVSNMYTPGKIFNEKENKFIDAPGVIKDTDEYLVAKGTYYTRKASGLYNHLLYINPMFENQYARIADGERVKMYPCKSELNDKFCYYAGKYPKEFAPEVDYDELFENTITRQVNEYITALGLPLLNKRLKVVMSLF